MLLEGDKDKYKNKAIFLAGLPGAGKSTIVNNMFSFDDNLNLSIYNMKKINPDLFLEKKYKGKKIDWSENKNQKEKDFEKSKELRDKVFYIYTKQKLPIVVDGVGIYAWYLIEIAQDLKNKGYEVFMVFVNTDLEKALKRNSERMRKVEDSFIKLSNETLKDNKKIYERFFGKSFFEIDNNEKLDKNKLMKIGRKIMS